MNPALLLNTLRTLEVELHDPRTHADSARLEQLLHPQFREFGRSGRQYCRADVLAEFARHRIPYEISSQDFYVEELAQDLALLTYRSAQVSASGTLERYSLRASVWQRTASGWQLRFHQGTPTERGGEALPGHPIQDMVG